MIINSSGTTGCDQILKQMMYRGRKLERRESLREREEKRKRRKKIRSCRGITITPNNKNFRPRKSSVLFKRL